MERELFNNVVNALKDSDYETQFNSMFLLACMLVYRLSNDGEFLKDLLQMVNEFDYNKNFKKNN